MDKITSRALLNVGTELILDEPNRTIELVAAGNLAAKSGVTLQAVYSKLVDLWTVAAYQDSPFPMYAIDVLSGQFQIGTNGQLPNGWKWKNDATRDMLRDGGWGEFDASGSLVREYVGIVGLGSVSTGAQLYYQSTASAAPVNFPFADQANAGVQVFGDAANGDFNRRSFFKGFCREAGKKYKDSVLADTGRAATGAYIVNLLLSNEDDLKIQASDAVVAADAPYTGITVTYYGADQPKTIGSGDYPFRVVVNGNGATLEQIYTKVQYLLRQPGDIDSGAGTVVGKTADALMYFVGDTLETTTGVFIENLLAADTNRVTFKDRSGVSRAYPYTASGVLGFNAALVGAGSAFRLMFSAPPGAGDDYGEAGAVTVNDAAGNPITGAITTGSIEFSYDYDGNTQAGFSAGTDRPVTLIGIRPGYGKFAVATGTLSRSKNISLSLVAELERAYA